MAFIYEVNGQRVEFEKEPTEKDIDEAARSLRPAPESRQPKPVEGQGGAAFGVYRPQGRRPESQQDREAAKDMAFQTARGVVTGTLGAPSDLANLPGVIYSATTGQPQPYQVPYGSEKFNEILPGKSDAPSAKLARGFGEVLAPVPSIKGLKAIPGAVSNVGDVVSGAVGTGTGYIARPGRTPRGYQVPSQRNPIGSTYTPPEEFAKFERGELPYGQMPQQRPISELPQGKLDQAAMMLSGGNIPNAGQGAKAFGERLGETYRNPLTAAADIGSMFFTGGVPVLTTLRGGLAGAQALADMRLANKGFTPELPKILDEYQTGVRPMPGVQPGPMPRGFQAAGPVSPGGLAQPTPAAQAAMATTQRVARTPAAPTQPRPQAQPFTLPDAGTHYNMAAQGSDNFGDTFNKAVTARAADLLKDAKQTGKPLTSQQANDLAFDEIKEWRKNNVDAFKPAPQPPELVGPVKPADIPAPVVKREPVYNTPGEMRKALVGKVTPDEMDRLVREKFPPTTPAENTGSLFKTADEIADVADGYQVRASMKTAAKGGITSKNGNIIVDQALFNDTAKSMGMPEIDFKAMPDLKGMSIAEARKAVATEINRQYKAADAYGKTTRGPNQSTLVKQANAGKTPEELKAIDDAIAERTRKMDEFLKTGKMAKSAPKPTTPEVAGPVRPEGAVDTPKMTNAELLELIKARSNKGKAPPGVMKMETGKKSSGNPIDDAPWLSNKEFENESTMRNLGLGSNEEYVLKTKYPKGNITKTADSKANSKAIEYNDGSSFMVRNNKGTNSSIYSIFNNDGTNYEITRQGNKIQAVEIYKNGEYIGGLDDHAFSNGKQWKVHQKIEGGPPGGGQILGEADIKEIGTAKTRKLFKELKNFDFNKIVDEQLARAEDLK